jgi:single-strand DNA-binding protein
VATDNQVVLVGNLADDPELRFTRNGVPVTNVRVAVNQRFFNRETEQWDDRLDGFFTANVWRDQAQNVADSLAKGTRVLVTGRVRTRSYETQNGETRWVTEVEADEVCPSLRWATARIEKTSRGGAQSSGASQGAAQQGAAPQGEANYGGAPPPQQGGQQQAPTPDEVPF